MKFIRSFSVSPIVFSTFAIALIVSACSSQQGQMTETLDTIEYETISQVAASSTVVVRGSAHGEERSYDITGSDEVPPSLAHRVREFVVAEVVAAQQPSSVKSGDVIRVGYLALSEDRDPSATLSEDMSMLSNGFKSDQEVVLFLSPFDFDASTPGFTTSGSDFGTFSWDASKGKARSHAPRGPMSGLTYSLAQLQGEIGRSMGTSRKPAKVDQNYIQPEVPLIIPPEVPGNPTTTSPG